MLTIGRTALRIIGLTFPLAGFCIVSGSVFQALGTPFYSLIVSVAAMLRVPQGTVKTRLRRGREQLRQLLNRQKREVYFSETLG